MFKQKSIILKFIQVWQLSHMCNIWNIITLLQLCKAIVVWTILYLWDLYVLLETLMMIQSFVCNKCWQKEMAHLVSPASFSFL